MDSRLHELLEDVVIECQCRCEDTYLDRNLHASDCLWYLAEEAQAILNDEAEEED